jgi:4-amino-4-deoxy-L-arabinose transferase-like glycosyltransferase
MTAPFGWSAVEQPHRRKLVNEPAGIVARAFHAPARALAVMLGLHVVVWTALPILVCPNLQLDLAEGLALGREWQLGYWKHPPLPWWMDDVVYRITGHIESVYLLGPLAAILCLYGVWLLAREVVDEISALVAVVALEGVHFYNFSAVKFGHDQMQLPFWAFTGLFFYRALRGGRRTDWILAGVFLAGAFLSKYAAFVLAITLGLFLLFDPLARRAWHTAGPYLMGIAFAAVFAPNLWWLWNNDFLPFRYVDQRAAEAAHWYQYFTFPVTWIVDNLLTLSPAIALLAIVIAPDLEPPRPAGGDLQAFNRRYVTALALGPFLVTTAIAAALGRMPVAMWGYPLWSFAPLAALMWFRPTGDFGRLHRFAVASIAILLAFPVGYAAKELLEPFVRDRPKATEFPGRLLADVITQKWHETTGMPLAYVGGAEFGPSGAGEFTPDLVAIYSSDRPRVIVHGDPRLSPWIERADVDRRGAVLIWEWGFSPDLPENLKQTFPQAELQEPLVLPRRTLYPRAPFKISYALVRPRGPDLSDRD